MMQSFIAMNIKNQFQAESIINHFTELLAVFSSTKKDTPIKTIWKSDNEKFLLLHWTNEQDSSVWKNERKAITFTGYFDEQEDSLINNIFSNAFTRNADFIQDLSGQFSILHINQEENLIQAFNTITRTEPLYYVDNNDFFVIGNKALMVHLMATMKMQPEYDLLNFGAFLNTGYFNNESTPYSNVNVMQPNAELTYQHNKLQIRELFNNNQKIQENDLNNAYYDELASIFIDSFKPLKKHSITLNSGLTGGKDSRLIVAGLNYLNIDFKTHTTGFEEHPDVIVAKRIARMLNIEHKTNIPEIKDTKSNVLVHDIMKRTIDTILVTDGMLSAYENVPNANVFQPNNVTLGGNGGEHLRGGFNKNVSNHNEEGLKLLLFKILNPFTNFVNHDIQANYEKHLNSWNDKSVEESPINIMMKYYIYYRTGKWSSVARSGYTNNNFLYQPFFDSKLVREVLRIPAQYLINDTVIYQILLRLSPQLVDVPFFADRWKFEAKEPIDGNIEKWNARKPVVADMQSKGSFNWRRTTLKDLKNSMFEEIFSTENRKVLDLINVNDVQKMIETGKSTNREIDMFMWNLYTSSVLLSNKWINDRKQSKVVEIRLPATELIEERILDLEISGLTNTDKNAKIFSSNNNLKCQFVNDDSKTNKYIHTFEGTFTKPPQKGKFPNSIVPQGTRLTVVEFEAESLVPQSILFFLMGYNNQERIINQSNRVNMNTTTNKYTISFEHEEMLYFKLAIKTVDKKDQTSNEWELNNIKVKFYK